MERLKDKVVLVTGSTTGIGKAIAKRCVGEGARVVLHGLEEDWGKEVQAELGEERSALCKEDLSQDGAAQRLVDFAVQRFGRLDVLVNNAAWVAPDRKSTRLNSSHVKISYAVFCLKKKHKQAT